jgi:hypothetical protein
MASKSSHIPATRKSSSKLQATVQDTHQTTSQTMSQKSATAQKSVSFLEYRLTKLKYKEVKTNAKIKALLKHISDTVLQNKTPHFPIISEIENNKNTHLQEIPDNEGFEEFVNFASHNKCSSMLFKNMILQIMISILSLHHFGVKKQKFNDIDIEKLTYHKTPYTLSDKRYFHYKIFEEDFYIQDCGYVWIFSTFDKIENNNYESNENDFITKHKYDYDDEDDEEDEYDILLEYLHALFQKLDNKQMKKFMDKLIFEKNDEINSLEREAAFFEKVLPLFNQPSKTPSNLANSSPYVIQKTRMTFPLS